MRRSSAALAIAVTFLFAFSRTGVAQQGVTAETSTSTVATVSLVPQLVNYAGVLTDSNGKPLTRVTGVTFLLYRDQQSGAPLWMETQNVQPDKSGHYSVMLGSTTSQGLPQDVFAKAEARWLGVQPDGQPEQPRVLLLSVPYALKAADAETVGGLPASAFMLANGAQGSRTSTKAAPSTTVPNDAAAPANATVTGKGVANFIPMWDSTSDIVDSLIFQKSSQIGINTTAPAATFDVNGKIDIRDTLTLFPKGIDPTLAINGTAFKIDQTGKVTFAAGQTFPGTGTLAGVTTATGSGLTGGGTRGTLTLGLTKTCSTKQVLQWNGSSWACSAVGSGTITGITTASGSGLTGGGTSGSLNLSLTTSCSSGQTLAWNGSAWACKTAGGSGTVTSVALSAPGSDFKVTGSPVTGSGTLGLDWNVAPTSTNTTNAIVKRDSTGSFNATNISATSAVSTFGLLVNGNALFNGKAAFSGNASFGNISATGAITSGSLGVNGAAFGNVTTTGTTATGTLGVNGNAVFGGIVGIGTNFPQVELNLDQGDNANNDALLIGNYNKGLQLRDTGSAVDLESWGVPLYVNNVTQQPLLLNPSGGPVYVDTASNILNGAPSALNVGAIVNSVGSFASASFSNDVFVGGNLAVEGMKNFRIDHPLDPTNKYLYHAAIESSEVLNQYSGNVVLDDRGEGRVEFPAWFAAINEDFRYQLTAIGAPGPDLYISEEIKDNSFTIAGGRPGMKVSWQVTARRNDAYMKAHPYVVEQDKPERQRGYYTDPELYGAPTEEGIRYAQEQRSKEQQSKTTSPVKVKQ
jgi:trimeric autotransporter adhesin